MFPWFLSFREKSEEKNIWRYQEFYHDANEKLSQALLFYRYVFGEHKETLLFEIHFNSYMGTVG